MKHSQQMWIPVLACAVMAAIHSECSGNTLERAAIAAHQDQLQNLVMVCEESRAYDIDPAVAAQEPPNIRQPKIDLKRTETFRLKFAFLNGSASDDRKRAQAL